MENKNWILGRPLVFGDKEQIAELSRLKAIKDAKANVKTVGLKLDDTDFTVERTSTTTIKFDCFECFKKVKIVIEEMDMEEDSDLEDDYSFGKCRHCNSEYRLIDGVILIEKD